MCSVFPVFASSQPSSPEPCAVYQTPPSLAGATSCGLFPAGTGYSRMPSVARAAKRRKPVQARGSTRPTSRKRLLPRGAKMAASPSSRDRLAAPSILKPCATRTVFVPPRGRVPSIRRSAATRRLRSCSVAEVARLVRSMVVRTRPKARRAVSRVRQNLLARTDPTGISSARKARPIARASARPSGVRFRCVRQLARFFVSVSSCEKSVAAWRK